MDMSTMITGILLVIVGFYSAIRGFVATKPFYLRFTFRGALELWVGVAGYYAVVLGTLFIICELSKGRRYEMDP